MTTLSSHLTRLLLALCMLALLQSPQAALAQIPAKKIVLLGSPKEHGAPGRHEYEKDLRELAWALEHSGAHGQISTQVVIGKAPRDLKLLEEADAIVIHGNGDWLKRETGAFFPQFADTDGHTYDADTLKFLEGFDALIKRKKTGLTVFHYTMWVENWVARRYFLSWLGGLWIPYASHNPVDTWTIRPIGQPHPILRGVKPWTARDEMYSRFFLSDNPGRTELLSATPAKAENGATNPVAWAYNRPDGGRSVVWGGNDFHDNLHLFAQQRRFLVNAILWSAGIDVPRNGADVPPPQEF